MQYAEAGKDTRTVEHTHLMHNNQFYRHNSVTAKKYIASYLKLEYTQEYTHIFEF